MIKKNMRLFVGFIITALVFAPYGVPLSSAQSNDTDAPDIQNVQIGTVTDNTVTITWETDEEADSLINYGLQEDYGIVRDPVVDKTKHSIISVLFLLMKKGTRGFLPTIKSRQREHHRPMGRDKQKQRVRVRDHRQVKDNQARQP
jgi:hypothetical protein